MGRGGVILTLQNSENFNAGNLKTLVISFLRKYAYASGRIGI